MVTTGDLQAVCLLDICRRLDIGVPDEMAILGRGNDTAICETVRPTLSSVDVDARRCGYEAAQMLDEKMAGKQVPKMVLVPPTRIAIRQSTDLMVIEDPDVVQALRFIRDYACKGIDVPRVADEVGVSRRALERRFLEFLGRTPNAEIIRVQIERARCSCANRQILGPDRPKQRFHHARVFQPGLSPRSRNDRQCVPKDAPHLPRFLGWKRGRPFIGVLSPGQLSNVSSRRTMTPRLASEDASQLISRKSLAAHAPRHT